MTGGSLVLHEIGKTYGGKRSLIGVSATFAAGQVSAVLGPNRFRRPAYAGNAVQEVEVSGTPFVASVRQTACAPSAASGSMDSSFAVTGAILPSTLDTPNGGEDYSSHDDFIER